jgi:hypothetical protein
MIHVLRVYQAVPAPQQHATFATVDARAMVEGASNDDFCVHQNANSAAPLQVHRSPVRNCARPAPNDQSSSAFVTKFTTTSVGEIPQLAESLSTSKR